MIVAAAKIYPLVEGDNRIFVMEYDDGRLFLSTPGHAVPITPQGVGQLGARATGLAIAMNCHKKKPATPEQT